MILIQIIHRLKCAVFCASTYLAFSRKRSGLRCGIFLDLEDGVPLNQKNQARGRVVSAGYKQIGIQNPPEAESPEESISI